MHKTGQVLVAGFEGLTRNLRDGARVRGHTGVEGEPRIQAALAARARITASGSIADLLMARNAAEPNGEDRKNTNEQAKAYSTRVEHALACS